MTAGESPARWRAEQVTVRELAGHERSELAVLRHALRCVSPPRKMQPFSPPVARLVRDAQAVDR